MGSGLLLLLNRRWRGGGLAIPQAGWLIVVALANMVFWSVVTFGPDETQTAHSSYADILLLSVGLLSFILTLREFSFFCVWRGNCLISLRCGCFRCRVGLLSQLRWNGR